MKKFLTILVVAVSALLVSSCGPKYAGCYKADLTFMQSGVLSTILLNKDGSASILNGATQETTQATWSQYIDNDGNAVENCMRIDFDSEKNIPYIMNFNTKLISYGFVNFNNNAGYPFKKVI